MMCPFSSVTSPLLHDSHKHAFEMLDFDVARRYDVVVCIFRPRQVPGACSMGHPGRKINTVSKYQESFNVGVMLRSVGNGIHEHPRGLLEHADSLGLKIQDISCRNWHRSTDDKEPKCDSYRSSSRIKTPSALPQRAGRHFFLCPV